MSLLNWECPLGSRQTISPSRTASSTSKSLAIDSRSQKRLVDVVFARNEAAITLDHVRESAKTVVFDLEDPVWVREGLAKAGQDHWPDGWRLHVHQFYAFAGRERVALLNKTVFGYNPTEMDPSTLENSAKALERSLDFWGALLLLATAFVVLGLILEYWHPMSDFISQVQRPAAAFPWKMAMEIFGGILITVGVAGELVFTYKASRVETDLRINNHQMVALLNGEAARLQKEAEDERLARVQLQKSIEWRHLSEGARKSLCKILPPQTVDDETMVVTFWSDPEPALYANEFADAIGSCRPLPLPVGSRGNPHQAPKSALSQWIRRQFGVSVKGCACSHNATSCSTG